MRALSSLNITSAGIVTVVIFQPYNVIRVIAPPSSRTTSLARLDTTPDAYLSLLGQASF